MHISMVFVVIGLIGNFLSMLVFSSPIMRGVSSNVYLLTLALSDSMYLVSVFMSKILTALRCFYFPTVNADVFNRSLFMCKSLQYLLDLLSNYSTCLIMAFTVERFFAVYRPLSFKESFTVFRARLACLLVFVILTVCIAPYHMMYIGRPYGVNVCTVLPDHEGTFTVLYAVEVLIFRILPVCTITFLNIFIVVKLLRLARAHNRRKTNMEAMRLTAGSKKSKGQRGGGGSGCGSRGGREDKNMQITVMLIVVSSTYILGFMPVLVHFVIWKLQRSHLISVSEGSMIIAQNYTEMLYVCGFAMNFFLYTISGRVFREQLILILKNCIWKSSPPMCANRRPKTGKRQSGIEMNETKHSCV